MPTRLARLLSDFDACPKTQGREPVRRVKTSPVSVACVEMLSASAVYPGSGLVVDPAQKRYAPVHHCPEGQPHDNQKSRIRHFAALSADGLAVAAAAD